METTYSFEMSVDFQQITRRYIPEDITIVSWSFQWTVGSEMNHNQTADRGAGWFGLPHTSEETLNGHRTLTEHDWVGGGGG
jgi:hypothetical protein